VLSEVKNVEFPLFWSQAATDIMTDKYFRKNIGVVGKVISENSYKQPIHRLANHWTQVGLDEGYFSEQESKVYYNQMAYMMIYQVAAPNSPQWFNTGLHQAYGITGPAQGHYRIAVRPCDERKLNSSPQQKLDNDDEFVEVGSELVCPSEDAYTHPQVHACFIQSIKDDLLNEGGIMSLYTREATVFKYGSGSGSNFDNLRGKGEPLSGGGTSSGLLSWLIVNDRVAGAIKSGGTTRRAAMMVCAGIKHPDIKELINWKRNEEKKAKALIAAGYPGGYEDEAYTTVSGQNSNNSIRVTDDFMEAVEKDKDWELTWRTNGKVCKTLKARELWKDICECAWECADPGLQYEDTINAMNTCSNDGTINASNPCSEYMFLDDTACNLASLNLVHFFDFKTKTFLFDKYCAAVDYWTTTLDISVTLAQYPSKQIALNTFYYRTLGLGYANLGTIIMKLGLAYDSNKGRAVAAMLTSLMGAVSYITSAKLAKKFGPFPRYEQNKEPMMKVINKHRDSNLKIEYDLVDNVLCNQDLGAQIQELWIKAVELGEKYGYRNAQTTLLAPTGTIAFIMDCDTTGVEPEYSLFKWKKLAGGGGMMIVNSNIPETLEHLGYTSSQISEIQTYLTKNQCMEGAPHLKAKHLPIFDTAAKNGNGKRFIAPIGHVRMMAAVQPFLSGAISKTVNMPEDSTVEDIADIYMQSWKMGVKAVALYRDNCKSSQPLSSTKEKKEDTVSVTKIADLEKQLAILQIRNKELEDKLVEDKSPIISLRSDIESLMKQNIELKAKVVEKNPVDVLSLLNKKHMIDLPIKNLHQKNIVDITKMITSDKKSPHNDIVKVSSHRKLPYMRSGKTIGAQIAGQKIFIRTGEYEDGTLAEIFIDMYKEGSSFRNMLNLFAILVSISLQGGTKLEKLVEKFTFTSFEPSGMVNGHPYIKKCSSIPDFVFRVLGLLYLDRYDLCHVHPNKEEDDERSPMQKPKGQIGSSPVCTECGSMTVRSGTCFKCINCGSTTGCG
jgi:ribonucleoside-diphosphate reductase alpha chain